MTIALTIFAWLYIVGAVAGALCAVCAFCNVSSESVLNVLGLVVRAVSFPVIVVLFVLVYTAWSVALLCVWAYKEGISAAKEWQ